MDHDAWMALAAEEYRRIVALLRSLDDDAWRLPTECPAWDVTAMVAHLCGAAEGTADLRRMVRQAALGRRRYRRDMLVDSMNEVQVADRAGRSPRELVEELEDVGRRGVATRTQLPAALRALVLPIGPPVGTKSLGYLMDCIYTRDAWMHRIDLCRAVGSEPEVTADHDGLLVADLVDEWATTHGRAFHLVLTGAGGLDRSVGDAGDVIEMDAVEFARAMSGRSAGDGLLAVTVPF